MTIVLSSIALAIAFDEPRASGPMGFSYTFWENFVVAVISVFLTIVGTYLLDALKRRREPKKQLSFDQSTEGIISGLDRDLRRKLSVAYNGKTLDELFSSRVRIENCGNSVVQSQRVRFTWPPDATVLDASFIPEIPEYGVAVAEDPKPFELVYKLGQLEKEQYLEFTFLVSSPQKPELGIFGSNPAGDVGFLKRSSRLAASESESLTRFARFVILFLTIPQLSYLIPFGELAGIVASVIRLGLFITIIPDIPNATRAIAALMLRFRDRSAPNLSIDRSELTNSVLLIDSGSSMVNLPASRNPDENGKK